MTIECKQKFKSYSDCQHGWVAVKRWMVKQLGIANDISHYSYERGQTVYLEEDCDLTLFIKAYTAKAGHPPRFVEGKWSERSPIRSYDRYSPEHF